MGRSWVQVSMWILAPILGVGLLVAVLYPLFVRPGPISHPPNCRANVKMLALANLIYQADWDDRFPLRDSWMDAIDVYVKSEHRLRCPALQTPEPNPQLYGYAFHRDRSGQKSPANPETAPLIFESIDLAKNAFGTLDSLPRPGRHEGKSIVGYADGSAKAIDTPK